LAKRKGATEEQVEAVRDPGRGPFTGREKLGFHAADRLHRSACEIDDEFYALLKRTFSNPEIIELVATAAAWEFFTRFVDALRIPTTPLASRNRDKKNKGKSKHPKGKRQK
jgi:alkylhydroperoxidase family enzyme